MVKPLNTPRSMNMSRLLLTFHSPRRWGEFPKRASLRRAFIAPYGKCVRRMDFRQGTYSHGPRRLCQALLSW